MSDPFEQVDFVRIFFKDGSCAFLKNHKRDVNEIITQLTDERAALKAENERLRLAGDKMYRYVGKSAEHGLQVDKHDKSKQEWLNAKGGKP